MASHNVYRRFMNNEDNSYVSVLTDSGDYNATALEIHDGHFRVGFSFDMWNGTEDKYTEERYKYFLEQMESIRFAANAAMDEAEAIWAKTQEKADASSEADG